MRPERRRILALIAGLAPIGQFARAQAWPSRPLRIITPFAAGGATDIYARQVAQQLQVALGQPVVVDNRPGGNFAIGTEAAAKAEPDGHTIFTSPVRTRCSKPWVSIGRSTSCCAISCRSPR